MNPLGRSLARVIATCLGIGLPANAWTQPPMAPTYTAAQATRGEQIYINECAKCHGDKLNNGEFGPPVKGVTFRRHWSGEGLHEVFIAVATRMPPGEPGSLGDTAYADVLAFLLSENGVAPSETELPANAEVLKLMAAPKP